MKSTATKNSLNANIFNPDGTRNTSNYVGNSFWKGFDNEKPWWIVEGTANHDNWIAGNEYRAAKASW